MFPKLRFLSGNILNSLPSVSACGLEQFYGMKATHLDGELRQNNMRYPIYFNGRPGEQQKVFIEIPYALKHQIIDFVLYLVDSQGVISELASNKLQFSAIVPENSAEGIVVAYVKTTDSASLVESDPIVKFIRKLERTQFVELSGPLVVGEKMTAQTHQADEAAL